MQIISVIRKMLEFKDKKQAIDWLEEKVEVPNLTHSEKSLLKKFANPSGETNYFWETDSYLKATAGELYYDWKSLNTLKQKIITRTSLTKLTEMIEEMDKTLDKHGKITETMVNYSYEYSDIFGKKISELFKPNQKIDGEKFLKYKEETIGKTYRKHGYTDAFMAKKSVPDGYNIMFECIVPRGTKGMHYLKDTGEPKVILKRGMRAKITDISVIPNPTNINREMIKVKLKFIS